MPHPPSVPALPGSFLGRFRPTMLGLVLSIFAWGAFGWLDQATIVRLVARVGDAGREVARLVAAFEAGTLRRRLVRPGAARPQAAVARAPRAATLPALPRGFGWLAILVPEAMVHGGALLRLLEDPAALAMLGACPRLVRVLRPLCRMMGQFFPALPGEPPREPRVWITRLRVKRVRRVRKVAWVPAEPEARAWWAGPAKRRSPMCCPYGVQNPVGQFDSLPDPPRGRRRVRTVYDG